MQHNFNTKIAEEYSIESAIILHFFYFWIDKNAKDNNNFHDGRYWTYNSQKCLTEVFTYMSKDKVSREVKKLEKEGLIIKGNYNKMKIDRTCWYAFTKKAIELLSQNGYDTSAISMLHNSTIHIAKSQNGKSESATPITINNTISKTINNTISESKDTHVIVDENLSSSNESENTPSKQQKRKPFKKSGSAIVEIPNLGQVQTYIQEKIMEGKDVKFSAQKFISHYNSNGWKDVVDWKAKIDEWIEGDRIKKEGAIPQKIEAPKKDKPRVEETEDYIRFKKKYDENNQKSTHSK